LDSTGVDALMIGRGAIGRPWLFAEIKHYLETGELLPAPTVSQIVDVIREQIKMNLEWRDDERSGILMLRRHFARYFPGLPNFRELKIALLRAESAEEVDLILDRIANIYSSFQPDYANATLQ
jgi:tRNA-dihydrouridine synthase